MFAQETANARLEQPPFEATPVLSAAGVDRYLAHATVPGGTQWVPGTELWNWYWYWNWNWNWYWYWYWYWYWNWN